jgi:F-type H+-transporting ATPase subunit b
VADPATAVANASADHGAGGLPQFDLVQWPGQIIWALLIFGILYILFAKVFVPWVGGTIDAREDKIAGDIGDARRLRDEAQAQATAAAEEMNQVRARAHKVAADAKAAAKAASVARQSEEDAKLAEVMGAAEARIAAARAEAMTHVRAIAADAAAAIIEHLTGAPAKAAEVEQALAGQA